MVSTLLPALREALMHSPDVQALTLFGSAARGAEDEQSDVDLQIITTRPGRFAQADWFAAPPSPILAYALRPAFGSVTKVTIVFERGGEADLVVLPAARLRVARALVSLGIHRRSALVRRGLSDLAIVLRPGFRVLKGGSDWEPFYRRVVAEVPDPRLDDEAVWRRGECAYADFCSLTHKVQRGELIAAQRWLHVHLADTNFALLHEWRLRRGERSFHDGRRLESILSADELAPLALSAALTPAEIVRAGQQAIATTRRFVVALTGREPRWPAPASHV